MGGKNRITIEGHTDWEGTEEYNVDLSKRRATAARDYLVNVEKLPAGEFQLMSAGTGITHSEYNPSNSETLEFLQIWIQPDQLGIEPGYQQKRFEPQPGLQLIA